MSAYIPVQAIQRFAGAPAIELLSVFDLFRNWFTVPESFCVAAITNRDEAAYRHVSTPMAVEFRPSAMRSGSGSSTRRSSTWNGPP